MAGQNLYREVDALSDLGAINRPRAQRGDTTYRVPERWSERTRVIELPESARDVKLTNDPPKTGRMAVA
jgi:hypothetical protein